MQNISFRHDALRLDGTVFRPAKKGTGKLPAILFVHGWTSERRRSLQYARALVRLGYVCLLFDMRGHGTSGGNRNNATNKEFLSDVVAAYDHLVGMKEVDARKISAVGSSFGGYLVAALSAKRKLRNLVLRVPADYPNSVFNKPKKLTSNNTFIMEWRRKVKRPAETYALEALHKFRGHVLIIESEKDDRIPHQTILNYVRAAKDEARVTHVLMKGAPHSMKDGEFKNRAERILTRWFKDRL